MPLRWQDVEHYKWPQLRAEPACRDDGPEVEGHAVEDAAGALGARDRLAAAPDPTAGTPP